MFVLVQEKLRSVSLPGLSWAGGGSQYIYLGAILRELCGDNTPPLRHLVTVCTLLFCPQLAPTAPPAFQPPL